MGCWFYMISATNYVPLLSLRFNTSVFWQINQFGGNVDIQISNGDYQRSIPYTLNTWTHIAWVAEQQIPGGTFSNTLYINNVAVDTFTAAANRWFSGYTLNGNLDVGTDINYPSNGCFNGYIDNVFLYAYPLSSSNINDLYNGTIL